LGRGQRPPAPGRGAADHRGFGDVSRGEKGRREDDVEPPHPRETSVWFGHVEAERALVEAYRGGRIAHAWLIGGPHGVGKATLAYRMARFVRSEERRVG